MPNAVKILSSTLLTLHTVSVLSLRGGLLQPLQLAPQRLLLLAQVLLHLVLHAQHGVRHLEQHGEKAIPESVTLFCIL